MVFTKIFLGDARDMKEVDSESINMVFADPPYNMSKKNGLAWAFSKHVTMQEAWDMFSQDDFFKFNLDWITDCIRVLKPNGTMFVCGSYHNIHQIGFIVQKLGLKILNHITWFKPNAQPNITCRMFTESTEHLLWIAKGPGWTFNYDVAKQMGNGKQLRNVWEIPLTPKSEKWAGKHPTQKPEKLLERVLLTASNQGDTVLDPFLGSGTTMAVAARLDRNAIGYEINEEYVKTAKRRIGFMEVIACQEGEV